MTVDADRVTGAALLHVAFYSEPYSIASLTERLDGLASLLALHLPKPRRFGPTPAYALREEREIVRAMPLRRVGMESPLDVLISIGSVASFAGGAAVATMRAYSYLQDLRLKKAATDFHVTQYQQARELLLADPSTADDLDSLRKHADTTARVDSIYSRQRWPFRSSARSQAGHDARLALEHRLAFEARVDAAARTLAKIDHLAIVPDEDSSPSR